MSKINICSPAGAEAEFEEDQVLALWEKGQIEEESKYWTEGMTEWRPIEEWLAVVTSPLPVAVGECFAERSERISTGGKCLTYLALFLMGTFLAGSGMSLFAGDSWAAIVLLLQTVVLVFLLWRLPGAKWAVRAWAFLMLVPGVLFWVVSLLGLAEAVLLRATRQGFDQFLDRINSIDSVLKTALFVFGVLVCRKAHLVARVVAKDGSSGGDTMAEAGGWTRKFLRRLKTPVVVALLLGIAWAASPVVIEGIMGNRQQSNLGLRTSGEPWKPDLAALKKVTTLPRGISGLAFDGAGLWAARYQWGSRAGNFYRIDPESGTWTEASVPWPKEHQLSAGGLAMATQWRNVWVADKPGRAISRIDLASGEVKDSVPFRPEAKRYFSGIADDGRHLWLACHSGGRATLLKMEPESGESEDFPLDEGEPRDYTHGLAWDGVVLWHFKNNRLSAISPADGTVQESYTIDALKRPAGLTWAQGALWIVEFEGQVWRLPGS